MQSTLHLSGRPLFRVVDVNYGKRVNHASRCYFSFLKNDFGDFILFINYYGLFRQCLLLTFKNRCIPGIYISLSFFALFCLYSAKTIIHYDGHVYESQFSVPCPHHALWSRTTSTATVCTSISKMPKLSDYSSTSNIFFLHLPKLLLSYVTFV